MTENLFYKKIIYITLILISNNILAQKKLNKEIKETHTLINEGALFLDNKYGDVYINGWDKNIIEIVVNVEVEGKNIEKAKALLSRINPEITATNKKVLVKSKILKKETNLFNKYINKTDRFNVEKIKTSINYIVSLPKDAEVEILNKYGDVIISDWNGKLKVDVEHGDIRIMDSITHSKLSIKYGVLKAQTLYDSSVILKGATFYGYNSNTLKIDSNGSEINLENINSLELYSSKDKIEVGQLNTSFGTIKYSTILINNLNKKVNFNINLAELKIKKLNSIEPIININQESSEVYINISNTSFNFSAQLEQGVLRMPKTMKNVNSNLLDNKNKIRHINAIYGNRNNRKGTFVLTGLKGIIILKEL